MCWPKHDLLQRWHRVDLTGCFVPGAVLITLLYIRLVAKADLFILDEFVSYIL